MKRICLIILLLIVTCFPKGGQVTNHNVDLIDTLYSALQEIYKKSPLLLDVDLKNLNNTEIWEYVNNYWQVIKDSNLTSYDKYIENAKVSTLYTYASIKFDTTLSRKAIIGKSLSLLSNKSTIHYSFEVEKYFFDKYLKCLQVDSDKDYMQIYNLLNKYFNDSIIKQNKESIFKLLPSSSDIYDSIPIYALTLTPRMHDVKKNDTSYTTKVLRTRDAEMRIRMGDSICIDSIIKEYVKLNSLLKKNNSQDTKINNTYKQYSKLLSVIMKSKNRKLIQTVIKYFNEPVFYEELYEVSAFDKNDSNEPKSCSTSFQYFILPYFQDFHKGDEFIDKELDKFIFGINDGEWTDAKKVELFFKKLNKWFEEKYGIVPDKPYPKWIRQKPIKPISQGVL